MLFRRALLVAVPSLVACLLIAPMASPVLAASAQSPEAFINDLSGQALKAINDKTSAAEREKRFADLLETDFDLPRISRFVLGRYWLAASDPEKQEFQKLFETYVVRAYSNRFSEYSGETVKVAGSRGEGDDALVMSQIVRPNGAPPVKVDWRVHKNGNDYRIVDVNVEGISMALTQKQEFAAVIERGGAGVSGLNKVLQDKLNNTTTAQQ